MRAHPVGVRLDQRRALAVAGVVERRAGHRVGGEHVVAVDPDAGEAEAGGPLVERDPGLPLERLGDRVLVVLAEEDDRRVEDAGPDERLVHVALAGGAVAEVGDDRLAVVGADLAVHGDAHGVAGRVQRLRADHDRVHVELVLVRVPAALVDAAEQAQRHDRVDARGSRGRRARGRSGRPCPAARSARPEPTCAASWPSRLAQMPSSPCRCRAVASASSLRTITRSRYRPRYSSSVKSTEYSYRRGR